MDYSTKIQIENTTDQLEALKFKVTREMSVLNEIRTEYQEKKNLVDNLKDEHRKLIYVIRDLKEQKERLSLNIDNMNKTNKNEQEYTKSLAEKADKSKNDYRHFKVLCDRNKVRWRELKKRADYLSGIVSNLTKLKAREEELKKNSYILSLEKKSYTKFVEEDRKKYDEKLKEIKKKEMELFQKQTKIDVELERIDQFKKLHNLR